MDGRQPSSGSSADNPGRQEILIINCGSSSLKMAWLHAGSGETIAKGLVERIGEEGTRLRLELRGHLTEQPLSGADHGRGLKALMERCWPSGFPPSSLAGIGHRVVHGGEFFRQPCLIDEVAIRNIESCAELAPLHNPANLVGIRVARDLYPALPHVAVFDTAFHQTMPEYTYMYGVPYDWYDKFKARRYGFHGTSHQFVSGEATRWLGRSADDCQLIVAHLGNGCSVCAVKNGKSVETSMGLTPLEGLVMGTRSGDVDPNLGEFISGKTGLSSHDVNEILNRKSGLLGLSGLSNDMRTLQAEAEKGHVRARMAIEVFCYRLARQVLSMCAGLDRIDALVFTGGIGENSAQIRARTLEHLRLLRPEIDDSRNAAHGRSTQGRVTKEKTSGLVALVVPTNEEWMIGRLALQLCQSYDNCQK